jgi:hypothetical protein
LLVGRQRGHVAPPPPDFGSVGGGGPAPLQRL